MRRTPIFPLLIGALTLLPSPSAEGGAPPLHPLPAELETLCRAGVDCLMRREPELARLGFDVERILSFHLKELNEIAHDNASDLVAIRRAQLRLRKLLKYCESGQFAKLGERSPRAGHYDESDALLGSRWNELQLLRSKATPPIERFIRALYLGGSQCSFPLSAEDSERPAHFFMIPSEGFERAEALAASRLQSVLQANGNGRTPLSATLDSTFRAGVTWILDVDNEWNDWNVEVDVDPAGISLQDGNWKVPPSVVAIHELGHVARTLPGEAAPQADDDSLFAEGEAGAPLSELGPVLAQIILQDELAKLISGDSIDSRRTYLCHPPSSPGKPPLDLGEVANVFRALIRKYGSPERAVLSREGRTFLRKHF